MNPVPQTPPRTEPIGFVGLGAMGAPMARRLANLGYKLVVHDINPHAVQSVVDCGARSLPSAKFVASEAKLVFTCLPSLEALRETVLGDEGLHAGSAIETHVDLSTTGAHFAREMAGGLDRRGIMMLDSPITGSVTTAANGKLGIMCSGPLAAFRHAEPVMRDLASAVVLYLGDRTGKAQTLKLLNNLLSATGMAASCEAFILGAKAGLDPQTMLEIINSGDASSSATRNKFPQSILPRRFDYGARMAITAKDISLTVGEAEELGVPMWIARSVQQVWMYAVSQGGADRDGTALITYLEPWAGVEVRSRGQAAQARPADAVPRKEPGALVVVCEEQTLPFLARRLREQKWDVALAGDDVTQRVAQPDPGRQDGSKAADRQCTLVGVAVGSTATGLLRALPPRSPGMRTVVNTCLLQSEDSVELARVLSERGDACVEALFTGRARDIEGGVSNLVTAGAHDALDHAKPLLESIGGRVFHVSERPGDAQVMQQINASLFATLLAATCEAYVAGAKAGLDPLTMTKIMGIETGRNAASARIIPEQVATRKFDHGKPIGEAFRELSLLSDEARRLGVTLWILDKARLLYGLAARLGGSGDDVTRLITHYEKWANTEVRADACGG